MIIFDYSLILIVGILIGLIGAGGSTFLLPLLVYIFHIPILTASTYVLTIVMISSAANVIFKKNYKFVNLKIIIFFGLSSFVSIFLTRKYIIHYLPDTFFKYNNFILTKDTVLLIGFSFLLIYFANNITHNKPVSKKIKTTNKEKVIAGFTVGILTGLFGIGGGFIYVPFFMRKFKLNFKVAVINSMFLVTVSCFFSLGIDLTQHPTFDFKFLIPLIIISTIGSIIGGYIRLYIHHLKIIRFFSYLTYALGIFIFIDQIVKLLK